MLNYKQKVRKLKAFFLFAMVLCTFIYFYGLQWLQVLVIHVLYRSSITLRELSTVLLILTMDSK